MVAVDRGSARIRITEADQNRFLALMPLIRQQARKAFACERADERTELVQATLAVSYSLFVQLLRRDQAHRVFASALARFAIRRVRSGRHLGCKLNRHDVTSPYGRSFHKLHIERLDELDPATGGWKHILVEDRRAGPAEIAAARLDFGEWLRSLPTRLRGIAHALVRGESPADVARQFQISRARVSQMRHELFKSWERFQQPRHHQEVSLCGA